MLRSLNASEEYKIKIIVIGDSGVGKTNIRERLCQNKFDPFSLKTIGVQFSTRRFFAPFEDKMQRFVLCLWDIVGDLNNPELNSSFFSNIMGVIYVFDLTNEETLKSLQQWRQKVEEHNRNRVVDLLVGNKKDLKHLREVSREAAEQYRKQMNFSQYFEVSALEEIGGGIHEAIYEYLASISN